MSDPLSGFLDHMHSVECAPDPSATITADDKMHRYRLAGDKPNTENGSYILRIDADGFAVGGCQSFRQGVWHKWHTKASRRITPEERAAWKQRQDDARHAQDAARAQAASDAAAKAVDIWGAAERTGTNAYLDRKGLTLTSLGCRMSRGSVVVPMWRDGALSGLQFIDPDGDKLFLKGAVKDGAYHAIKATVTDPADPMSDLLVIGEGLATMGALHASLGCSVIVAFDAGNLKPVAVTMRAKYPAKTIIIASDADQWTLPANRRPDDWDDPAGDDPRWQEWRDAGICVDTGSDKAHQAAIAIGGALVLPPPFPATDAAKRTDWWDYWRDGGNDAVRAAFDGAMRRGFELIVDGPEYGDEYGGYEDTGQGGFVGTGDVFETNPVLKAVRPLGRSGKTFYFFPRSCGQIMDFSGPALANMQNLVTMAPRTVWESNFDVRGSEKKMAADASMMLIEACNMLGIYNPETERGVGVWHDDGQAVFNAGDRVFWPGGECLPPDYQSGSVYVMGPRVGRIVPDQMTNADAGEMLRICLALGWKGKPAGYMLAGWIVTALVGGALRWRSHIVLTGEKGSGKSWVIENIIKPLMGKLALARDGGTTEARLRIDIGSTARPVIMDESESETMRDRSNMEQVFMLARKASSGSNVANFNGVYPIRSSFCFAAINPRIVQGADLDRNTILHLVVNRSDSARDDFKALERRVLKAMDATAADRLLSRCFHNLPVLLQNIETFSDVLAEQEGNKRFGDQFGTLIAGAYSLTSTALITREAAAEWCAKHDWRWAQADNDQTDGEKLLAYIMSARLRHDDRGLAREASVGRLIERALTADGLERDVAQSALGEYGMRIDRDWLYVASPCKPMVDILKDTAWGGSYRRALGEIEGAVAHDKTRFTSSLRVRAIAIPMRHVRADGADGGEVELPFGMDEFR